MSVNAVCLIGLVAGRPMWDPESSLASVLVVTAGGDGAFRERHRVVVERSITEVVLALGVGQQIVVTGTVQRDRRKRVIVVARELWPIGDVPGGTEPSASVGTHASPREHQRAGHWRRVSIGGPRERLVWVRTTTVGRDRRG
ncbi:MAG: hypothetical protein ACYDCS_05935 [Candidatus Dormibacteria bacterium]